jgi:hypothetical protein
MIISKEYGPQFDPTDGTVGDIKLVKRWVIVKNSDGFMWPARQGRYTFATEDEAAKEKELVEKVNSADKIPEGGLGVADRWCWPEHFDPVSGNQ